MEFDYTLDNEDMTSINNSVYFDDYHSSTFYYVTFQVDSGDRLEFCIPCDEFEFWKLKRNIFYSAYSNSYFLVPTEQKVRTLQMLLQEDIIYSRDTLICS